MPETHKPLVVAIDGPAAAGKGTLAKRLADHLGLPYLDTGLLYRAIGKLAQVAGLDLDDSQAATAVAERLAPADLGRPDLRGREAGELASRVAVHPGVRAALVAFQRDFAAGPAGAVLDGRDIGTVICPDADVKLYVTASAEVRARRRAAQLRSKGEQVDEQQLLAEIVQRDRDDRERAIAPLAAAADALCIDSTSLSAEAVVDLMVARIQATPCAC